MDLNELEKLKHEAAALRKEVEQLKDALTARKQSYKIVKLIAKQQDIIKLASRLPENMPKAPLNLFPIKSQKDLEAAETGITEENRCDYIALAKALLLPGSFKKNLDTIFGVDVIMAYNVDGRRNRKRMQDYPNLLYVLYKATNQEGWPYKSFLDDLRHGFNCAKNKHLKREANAYPSIKIEDVITPYYE